MASRESLSIQVRSIGYAEESGGLTRLVVSPEARKGLKELDRFSHLYLFLDSGGRPEVRLCRIVSLDEEAGRLLLHPALPECPAWVFDVKPYFPVDDRVVQPIGPGSDDGTGEWFPDFSGPVLSDPSPPWGEPVADGAVTAEWVPTGLYRDKGAHRFLDLGETHRDVVEDLQGYSHLRVLWAFHRFIDERFRTIYRVRPPYPGAPMLGVFASRSPVRPNPVAMTTVRVLAVAPETGRIEIVGMDAFDDTPVLRIMPYVASRHRVKEFRVPPWVAHWPDWFREEAPREGGTTVALRESHASVLRGLVDNETETAEDPALLWKAVEGAEAKGKPDDFIRISGARQNNLKNLSLSIPKNKFTVITGVSGSGKSTLAFDTLYAESQRRFMDTLSTLGRQAFGDMEKPDVESISGLPYAIAIEQKSIGRNVRSTVGTITEIYDFLRLLYSRVAKRYCPDCGEEIDPLQPEEITEILARLSVQADFELVDHKTGTGILRMDDRLRAESGKKGSGELKERLRKVLAEANHSVRIRLSGGGEFALSSHPLCPGCDRVFFQMTSSFFSFNHPDGMCPECKGLGKLFEVDPEKIVPRGDLSLLDGASPWWGDLRGALRNPSMNWMRTETLALAGHLRVDLERSWMELPDEFRHKALYGTGEEKLSYHYDSKTTGRSGIVKRPVYGAVNHIRRLFEERPSNAAQTQTAWFRFTSEKGCPLCEGERLSAEGRRAMVAGLRYPEAAHKSIGALLDWVTKLPGRLERRRLPLAADLLVEIRRRTLLLADAGLEYLTLDRPSATLSGGEAQRIRLAGQLGCGLNNLLYVLDEPSMGLHARDHERMLRAIEGLRDGGNTVVVVEHDPETMRSADFLVDMGPGAGLYGGEIVACGSPGEVMSNSASLTGAYLSGKKRVLPRGFRRELRPYGWLTVSGARRNNLKDISVSIPLGCITAVTGVRGSGKSSLVHQVLCPSVRELLGTPSQEPELLSSIEGIGGIDKLVVVDQSPIGRTPRSNPASYTGLWDAVRTLFAASPEAKRRGYRPSSFSFNSKEGACPACEGDGRIRTEMHFMPDVWSICPLCRGKRFRQESLDVIWKQKNIADVLDMEIASADTFFAGEKKIHRVLKTLNEVGLGYLKLGQSALDLSGGEAQRVKLAKELCRPDTGRTLFILDEPTTGLHFEDIRRLIDLLLRLKKAGNTVLLVEHNLDFIAAADYIIDLGPEGGDEGGYVVVQGTVDAVMNTPESHTGRYLSREIRNRHSC